MSETEPTDHAPEAADAERRRPRFICEYDYTDELLERFARLQADPGRGAMLLATGAVEIAAGAAIALALPRLRWAGVLLGAVGAYSLWYRANMARNLASRFIRSLERDEAGMGGRERRVVITDEAVLVFSSGDRCRRYELADLTGVQRDDAMVVAVFGTEGVALPLDSLALGGTDELARFLESRRGRGATAR